MRLLTSSQLLVTTYSHHNVIIIDMETGALEDYIGVFDSLGSTYNGHRVDDVRLDTVYGIEVYNSTSVFIGARAAKKVLQMNFDGDQITSRELSVGNNGPRVLKFDHPTGHLYLTTDNLFGVFYNAEGDMKILAGSGADGPLSSVNWRWACSCTKLDQTTWFITDYQDHRSVWL